MLLLVNWGLVEGQSISSEPQQQAAQASEFENPVPGPIHRSYLPSGSYPPPRLCLVTVWDSLPSWVSKEEATQLAG